jgi:hypothetical protein
MPIAPSTSPMASSLMHRSPDPGCGEGAHRGESRPSAALGRRVPEQLRLLSRCTGRGNGLLAAELDEAVGPPARYPMPDSFQPPIGSDMQNSHNKLRGTPPAAFAHSAVDTALGKVVAASEIGGGRLVVVDALDDEAQRFYEHFHFAPVQNRERRLVMKMSTAAKALGVAKDGKLAEE